MAVRWNRILLQLTAYFFILTLLVHQASSIWCYRCHSTQPGCGKELSIRLQRWHWCSAPNEGGGENLCVKVIEKRGSEEHITRECLSTVRRNTVHRQKIPTVQRHGYCTPARNNDPWHPNDEKTIYCFCNDWNGCNGATDVHAKFGVGLIISFGAVIFQRLL